MLNEQQWTDVAFKKDERIDCTLTLIIAEKADNTYKAELQVASRRPVYNSSYITTMLNFRDTEFYFNYIQGQSLNFNTLQVTDNLIAVISYYAYIVIGLDFDSFSMNGGKPYFTKAVTKDGKVIEEFDTEVINGTMCSEKTLKQVKDILRGVVEKGTGKAVNSDMVPIAGKTGTAMIASGGGYSGYYVSFCGYFPADNPQYTCFVGIRRPQGSPSGGLMPGAVFRNIAENVYARNFVAKLIEAPKDTVYSHTPKVKSGSYNYTKVVLDKLHQDYSDIGQNSEWVTCVPEEADGKLSIKSNPLADNLVPSVAGLGERNAVFFLENA